MPLSRIPTPPRARRSRPVVSGVEWCAPEDVPGGVLSPEADRILTERLQAITEAQRRARLSAWSCYIGG